LASAATRRSPAKSWRGDNLLTDPLFYLLAIPAVIALGIGKGGFSGVGTLSTPLLALTLPPLQAAAILLPILITQDMISVWVYRRDWSARILKVTLPGAMLGIALGWALAAHVSDAAVRLSIGLIGTGFVLHAWFGRRLAEAARPSAANGLFWGAVSGFVSMLSHAGGPPFSVHVLPQKLDKLTLVGTTTIFFAVVNAVKLVPYGALGQFSAENIAASAVLFPLAVASNFLGIWLVRRTPTELFYRIAYLLVLLISLELIRSGVMGIVGG
jgi:uncharacterized membrane protein YfcA